MPELETIQIIATWALGVIGGPSAAWYGAKWVFRLAHRSAMQSDFVTRINTGLEKLDSTAAEVKEIKDNLGENGGKSLGAKVSRIDKRISSVEATTFDITNLFSDRALLFFCDEGECRHVNTAFLDLVGYGYSEMVGQGWWSAIGDTDRDRVRRAFASAVADKRLLDEPVTWRHQSGITIETRFKLRSRKDPETREVLNWRAEVKVNAAHQTQERAS